MDKVLQNMATELYNDSEKQVRGRTIVSYTITADDLSKVIDLAVEKAVEKALKEKRQISEQKLPKYLHGLQGIADLFDVSKVTAQKYKNTWLAGAVKQNGKTLLTDTEMALKLFAENIE